MFGTRLTDEKILAYLKHLDEQREQDKKEIMADLTKLSAAVATNTDLTGKAIQAIQAGNDQTGVDALASSVTTNNTNLSNALNPTPTQTT